jgi:serine/threonine protein kinase
MEDTSMHAMIQIIKKDPPQLQCESWNELLRPFVDDCLQKNPYMRPSAHQLLKRHKSLWGKAKDGKYLVNQLDIKNNPITTIRPSYGQFKGGFYQSEEIRTPNKGQIQWNFDLDETD